MFVFLSFERWHNRNIDAPGEICSQESEEGHWHIPVVSEHDCEAERTWLCIMRSKSRLERNDSATRPEGNSECYQFMVFPPDIWVGNTK